MNWKIWWEILILCITSQKRAFFILLQNRLCCAASSDFSLPFSSLKLCKRVGFFSWELKCRDSSGVSFKQRLLPAHLHTPLTAITFPSLLFPGFTDFFSAFQIFFFLFLVLVSAQFWICDAAVKGDTEIMVSTAPISSPPSLNQATHSSYICLQSPSLHQLISEGIGLNWSQISTIVSSGIWQLNDLERLEKEICSREGFVPLEPNARVLLPNNWEIPQKLSGVISHSLVFIFSWLKSCLAVVFSQAIKFRLELFTLLLWPPLPQL